MADRRVSHACLILGGVLCAALLCELMLRVLVPRRDALFVFHPGMHQIFHPAAGVMPGIEGTSEFIVNDVGLRGDAWDPESKTQILCVGGSTTECLYLDQSEAWPQLVQQLLGDGAWVANAGISGRRAPDHVVQLRYVLERPPTSDLGFDHVVILEGANDLLLPLVQGEDYDPEFHASAAGAANSLSRMFRHLPDDLAGAKSFPKNTHIYRLLQPLRGKFNSVQRQDEAGLIFQTWRSHRAAPGRLLTELPDLTATLSQYRRSLTEIVALCRAAGARPLLLTQPVLWRADNTAAEERLMWMGGVGEYQKHAGQPYYSSDCLARGMDMFNDVCREVAAELHTDIVDLATVIPRDLTCFYDDMHFTEEGARQVAAAVAAALR